MSIFIDIQHRIDMLVKHKYCYSVPQQYAKLNIIKYKKSNIKPRTRCTIVFVNHSSHSTLNYLLVEKILYNIYIDGFASKLLTPFC